MQQRVMNMHVYPAIRFVIATGLVALVAGCMPPSPGSDADLSKLAAAAPASAKPPNPITMVDGPGGTKRPLANLDFVLSPVRDEAQLVFQTIINPDCSDLDGIDIRITMPPRHGSATVMHELGFPSVDAGTPLTLAKCANTQHIGKRVLYRRNPGFIGIDELTYEVYASNGQSVLIHYRIVAQ